MGIKENINEIQKNLNDDVKLVVAVKYANIEQIKEVIESGVSDIGFNTFQQLKKVKEKIGNVKIHFIGHLQSNKIKNLIESRVYLIQSVDSYKLVKKINEVCLKLGIKQKILLQIKTDLNKEYGFSLDEINLVGLDISKNFSNVEICGLMTIPSVNNSEQDYVLMKKKFDELSELLNKKLEFLSMGMSNDYELAIKNGSNMVRVGSKIFM
jgi:PLP dependent protein